VIGIMDGSCDICVYRGLGSWIGSDHGLGWINHRYIIMCMYNQLTAVILCYNINTFEWIYFKNVDTRFRSWKYRNRSKL